MEMTTEGYLLTKFMTVFCKIKNWFTNGTDYSGMLELTTLAAKYLYVMLMLILFSSETLNTEFVMLIIEECLIRR